MFCCISLSSQNSNIPKKFDNYYDISSFPFYAPHDCICQMFGTNQAGAGGYYMYWDINDVMTWPFAGVTPANWQISHTFFMKKGQKLTLREGAGLIYWGVRVTEIIP